MEGPSLEQMRSLVAAANSHGDLAVKLSSLRQVGDLLWSADPSLAGEVFPYLAELQSSPEPLVRKLLIEVIEDVGLNFLKHSATLMPVLLSLIKDADQTVAHLSIVSGMKFFHGALEEIAMQMHRDGEVAQWAESLWTWMVKVKDAVHSILFESVSVATKLLALKYMETVVLLFTPDAIDEDKSTTRGLVHKCAFNVSRLPNGNSVVNPTDLISEANNVLLTFLDMLQSVSSLPGPLAIAVINCLAAIGRKRTQQYDYIFSALLELNAKPEAGRGVHASSLQYSLRSAFLGFLRSTDPIIIKSREKLIRSLRAMSAGDAADQVIRQVNKILKCQERALHNASAAEGGQGLNQQLKSGGAKRKRATLRYEEPTNTTEVAHKRVHHNSNSQSSDVPRASSPVPDRPSSTEALPNVSVLNSSLSPVEQMIALIAVFLTEGEQGVKSLEVLLSQIHPDLLADIVIANMKNLPKSLPPPSNFGSLPMQSNTLNGSVPVGASIAASSSMQSAPLTRQGQISSPANVSTSTSDLLTSPNQLDKRDPRRDPRRLDPRLAQTEASTPVMEEAVLMQSGLDVAVAATPATPPLHLDSPRPESSTSVLPESVVVEEYNGGSLTFEIHQLTPTNVELIEAEEVSHASEITMAGEFSIPYLPAADDSTSLLTTAASPAFELEPSASSLNAPASEESCEDLPPVPLYLELPEEQEQNVRETAVKDILETPKKLESAYFCQMRVSLLARLASQAEMNADEQVAALLREGIVLEYQQRRQGHELVMHVLYHLHTCMTLESSEQSLASDTYEKFILRVAKSLLDTLPASDKSLSRLLGEAPVLTDSVMELLDKICCSEGSDKKGKDNRDGDRVTQGLGAVWHLILGRPLHRETCLNIALKCAVHVQDDTRAKAIRLVANKLYKLNYLSDDIDQFARNMLMSAVERGADTDSLRSQSVIDGQLATTDKPAKEVRTVSAISFAEAQRLISLYFALCIKNLSLLRLVFDVYPHAVKSVKQVIHRHFSTLVRALGSSYKDLFRIVSDPPKGCEHLLMLMVQILTEQASPSSDLIATVKHLYETKLKDATILIPVLSSFSKEEVLPIFPRLVELPLDKFQTALAHILQGSAYSGPALTPAEVLVAIHDINPDKEKIPLKKVMEVCSACFEQRTVFTHQVLTKALNQMVDQTPLPLLFMRTVIQSIDAFPTLVDFVMEILSKLVKRQVMHISSFRNRDGTKNRNEIKGNEMIWRMPKFWVGFLKCVSQTQPHSFPVLLQLPAPQLESALNKHAKLRGLLAAYATQPSVKASLPRSTLEVLSPSKEQRPEQPLATSAINAPDASPSAHRVPPT